MQLETVSNKQQEIQITDLQGKVLLHQLIKVGTASFKVDVSRLSKAAYLLVVTGDEKRVLKFVKQ